MAHPHDLQRLTADERRDEEDPRRSGLPAFGRLLLEAVERTIGPILDEDESGDHGLGAFLLRVELLGPLVVAQPGEAVGHLDPSADDESEGFLLHETPLEPL